jgi:hypothetical protein
MRFLRWLAVGALAYAPARAAAAANFTIPAAWTVRPAHCARSATIHDCALQNTTLAVPKAERLLLAQGGFAAVNALYNAAANEFVAGACLRVHCVVPGRRAYSLQFCRMRTSAGISGRWRWRTRSRARRITRT